MSWVLSQTAVNARQQSLQLNNHVTLIYLASVLNPNFCWGHEVIKTYNQHKATQLVSQDSDVCSIPKVQRIGLSCCPFLILNSNTAQRILVSPKTKYIAKGCADSSKDVSFSARAGITILLFPSISSKLPSTSGKNPTPCG